MADNINKDAVDEAAENVNNMADTLSKMKEEMDVKMEEILKSQANLNKVMIRSNEDEKEVGENYGFLQAKSEVAKGKIAKVPYWDERTEKRFGEYCHMLYEKDYLGIKKAFGDNVQDNLSNWTPTEFRSELVRLQFINSVMLPMVTIVPMARDKVDLPKPSGNYTYGFVDAGGAMTDSKVTVGKIQLDSKKIYAMAVVNKEDLDDPAYPFAPYIALQMGEDGAKLIDKVILYGDLTPVVDAWDGGFDGWAEAVTTNVVTGSVDASPTFAELITFANMDSLIGKLDELELEGAKIIMSPQAWNALRAIQSKVSDGAGGTTDSGVPVILPNGAYEYNYMGFPVVRTSRCIGAATASEAAVFFGNPKWIYFGDRMDLRIDTSEHYRFANDQVCFRALQRMAVTVGIEGALAQMKFGAES